MSPSRGPPSWAEATAVKQINSHEYEIFLQNDWCIGTVPNGGYVASCFLRVASAHFSSTLKSQNQPHTLTMHLEFPRRTEIGPATFSVKDIKLGRQTSTIHISLQQHGKDEVIGYLTNTNLHAMSGVTFPTGWTLSPPPPSFNAAKVRSGGEDPNWAEQSFMPFSDFRKASSRVRFFFPRAGQVRQGMNDQWITFREKGRFTTESLGYVGDMFPQIVEGYREDEDPYFVKPAGHKEVPPHRRGAKYWYPTVVFDLEIKKALPDEGAEWLYCRSMAKEIKKGRLDIEVIIMDEGGELVAVGRQVALVLSSARNLAVRTRDESKI